VPLRRYTSMVATRGGALRYAEVTSCNVTMTDEMPFPTTGQRSGLTRNTTAQCNR